MAPPLADAELIAPRVMHEAVVRPQTAYDIDLNDGDERTAARGIIIGVLIAWPFWTLIIFAFYMLL
jgi:hypothetical protein